MASSSASGLKDLLSPQQNSNSKPIKPLTTASIVEEVAQKLEDVSLESNSPFSNLSSPPSQSLQFSMSIPSNIDMSLNIEENLGKRKEEHEIRKDKDKYYLEGKLGKNTQDLDIRKGKESYYLEKNIGKEIEDDKNKQFTARKCFPPQISCLKNVKVGKPFKYLAYDKESDNYLVQETKIPEGSLFRASREDGRLKLFANFVDEEESQEN